MKSANVLFSLIYLFAAAVQFNDPDPIAWIAVYVLAAAACILFLLKKTNWIFPAVVGAIAFLWMLLLVPQLLGTPMPVIWSDVFGRADMKTEAVEITREIFGLLIVAGWMGWLTRMSRQNKA